MKRKITKPKPTPPKSKLKTPQQHLDDLERAEIEDWAHDCEIIGGIIDKLGEDDDF